MRLLVIGQDSAIGAAITDIARRRGHDVTTTALAGPADIHLDLSAEEFPPLPDADTAIFVAAMSRFLDCREKPDLARRINVEATTALAKKLQDRGARPLLLSTAAVFDGLHDAPHENAPTCPASEYGALKAEAERNLLALDGAVLRMTKVLSPVTPLFQRWLSALRGQQPVKAFTDLYMAPVALADAAEAVLAIAATRASGIHHLSSDSQISYHQAACHIASRLNAATSLVTQDSAASAGLPSSQIIRFATLGGHRLTAMTGRGKPTPLSVLDRIFFQAT